MVRDVVERVISNPTAEDLSIIKAEAKALAVNSGALPDTVEVYVEIDALTQKVTAIALGSSEVRAADSQLNCDENEARDLATKSIGAHESETRLLGSTGTLYVFTANKTRKKR